MASDTDTDPPGPRAPRRERGPDAADSRSALPRRTRWLANDWGRPYFTIPVMLLSQFLVLTVGDVVPREPLLLVVLSLASFFVSYAALTVLAFIRLDAGQFAAALTIGRPDPNRTVPRWKRYLLGARGPEHVGGDGPSWPVVMAAVSLAVAFALVANQDLREDPAAILIVGALVVSSWLETVVAYALHIARLEDRWGGLRFPPDDRGETQGRVFADYLALAVGTQASYGPGDVEITNSRMRGTLAGHTLVAFLFNTIILAMLISSLVAQAAS